MMKYGIDREYFGSISGTKIIPNTHIVRNMKVYIQMKNISFLFNVSIFNSLLIVLDDKVLYISTEFVELNAMPKMAIILARFSAKLNKPTSSIE